MRNAMAIRGNEIVRNAQNTQGADFTVSSQRNGPRRTGRKPAPSFYIAEARRAYGRTRLSFMTTKTNRTRHNR